MTPRYILWPPNCQVHIGRLVSTLCPHRQGKKKWVKHGTFLNGDFKAWNPRKSGIRIEVSEGDNLWLILVDFGWLFARKWGKSKLDRAFDKGSLSFEFTIYNHCESCLFQDFFMPAGFLVLLSISLAPVLKAHLFFERLERRVDGGMFLVQGSLYRKEGKKTRWRNHEF